MPFEYEVELQAPEKETRQRKTRAGRFLLIAGAVLVGLGVLGLVSVAVYIHVTNTSARRAQEELQAQWEAKPLPVTEVEDVSVAPGAPVARLEVPRLNLDAIVVELADIDDRANLNRGPGHVPGTAFPGMPGNVFIAGHRTTYGAPFGRIDELRDGDQIIFTTAEGKQVYTVYETKIVEPTDLSVLDQEGEPRVSLMACHPKFSASKRIIVLGRLTGGDIN